MYRSIGSLRTHSLIRQIAAAMCFTAVLVLTACGGGGGGDGFSAPIFGNDGGSSTPIPGNDGDTAVEIDPLFQQVSSISLASALSVGNEPMGTSTDGQYVYIGTPDISQVVSQFAENLHQTHGSARTGHLRTRDGITAARIVQLLMSNERIGRYPDQIVRWASRPTIRMVTGTSPENIGYTRAVVRILNSILPSDMQLTLEETGGISANVDSYGYIDVGFAPASDWWRPGGSKTRGSAWTRASNDRIQQSLVMVDPNKTRNTTTRMVVLMHEILHGLGRRHPTDSRHNSDTIMRPDGATSHGWLLFSPLDQAVLHAAYSRFDTLENIADLSNEDFGVWSDETTYVFGIIGDENIPMQFGAAWQNGLVRPFAGGHSPSSAPSTGTSNASWSGRLLGMTPEAETVAGAMAMTVRFSQMEGDLDFTDLEKWQAHAGPGAPGTGTQWDDGELNYDLSIDGAVFLRSGGDDGEITGRFFGNSHQGAAGTLTRSDLVAGFAGNQ